MTESDIIGIADPLAGLERMYIAEYLQGKGHTVASLQQIPEEDARQLMADASPYVSIKLAEVETRARFVLGIHGVSAPGS